MEAVIQWISDCRQIIMPILLGIEIPCAIWVAWQLFTEDKIKEE